MTKNTTSINLTWVAAAVAVLVGLFLVSNFVSAATQTIVTQGNTQGFSTADTRPGGAVNFVADSAAPAGTGALQLTSDATTAAKAQYLHAANTPLSTVTELSYYTKQASSTFAQGAPSYQLVAFLTGTSTGLTTLVYEPYQNTAQGAVLPNTWQQWDVDQGLFWSSRTVTCSNGTIAGSPGGPASYTLAQINAACPGATIGGFGVNIGTNNPGYTVLTDLVNFNGTSYNFEVNNLPDNNKDCKKNSFGQYTDQQGNTFTSEKSCKAVVKEEKKAQKQAEKDAKHQDKDHGHDEDDNDENED